MSRSQGYWIVALLLLLLLNTEKGVVGVTGPNVDSTLDAMNEIKKIFQDDFYTSKREYRFFELSALMHRESKINPINTMSKIAKGVRYIEGRAKILQTDLAVRSIRFSPPNKSPQDLDYFDFTIEPSTNLPTKLFLISVIYRQRELSDLSDKAANSRLRSTSLLSL